MGRREQVEQDGSVRRFREAIYRALTGHRKAVERQTEVLTSLAHSARRIELHAAHEDARRQNEALAERARQREASRLEELTDPKPISDFMFVSTFAALRLLLVFVPEEFFERRQGGVRIVCACRELLEIPNRNFHECGCGRLYVVTENTVKVLPLEKAAVAA